MMDGNPNHQSIGWKRSSGRFCGWVSPILALAVWSRVLFPKLGDPTPNEVLFNSCVIALAIGFGLSATRHATDIPRRLGIMNLVATVPLVLLIIIGNLWDGRWYRIYMWWTSWRRLYRWPPEWEFLGN